MVAHAVLRQRTFDLALSTGSGPAVAVLPQTARMGVSSHYIESAARSTGPSLSGRLVSKISRIHTYTQYPVWANRRWHYRGSIFDGFAPGPIERRPSTNRVVVTVGTQDGYPFERLFTALAPLLAGFEVLWQTGDTSVGHLGIDGRYSVPHDELKQAIAEADVVIAHAGTGSALTAIEAGKCPILVPRLARHGEHIDDHQLQIADDLQRRGLAIMSHVETLDETLLFEAASRGTIRTPAPAFLLDAVAPPHADQDGGLLPQSV